MHIHRELNEQADKISKKSLQLQTGSFGQYELWNDQEINGNGILFLVDNFFYRVCFIPTVLRISGFFF